LVEPGEQQLLTLATWSPAEAQTAWLDLCRWAACLCWCPHCQRLVAAGRHGSSWQRQWWANDIGTGLATCIWHMQLLREREDAGVTLAADAPPPPPPPATVAPPPAAPAAALPCGLKEIPPPPDDSGDWEWVPDEGDADAVGSQAESDQGEH
jgi:hypothetical protein